MRIGYGKFRIVAYALIGAFLGVFIIIFHELLELYVPDSRNLILLLVVPLIAGGMALLAFRENLVYGWGSRLDEARQRINDLMMAAVAERHWVQTFHDPSLATCWRELDCDEEECPAHGREHARCWLIAGTFCRGEVQGQMARKLNDCRLCPVYEKATGDPVREITENFFAMNYLLSEREEQLSRAYGEAHDRGEKLSGLVALSEAALSSVHLSEVLKNLLESAASFTGADIGFVSLADAGGERLSTAATYGMAPGAAAELSVAVGEGIVGRAFAGTYIAVSEDLQIDGRFVSPQLKSTGIRTLISLPVVSRRRPLGMLTLGTFSSHHYSEEEKDSLCVAADRLAAAVENVELQTELSRDRSQIELMEAVTRDVVSGDHISGIYDSFINHAAGLLQFDRASLIGWRQETGEMEILAVSTSAAKTWLDKGLRLPRNAAAAGAVIDSGQSMVRDSIAGDEYPTDKLLLEEGIHSSVIIPLRFKGAVLGAVDLGSFRTGAFSREDLELLEPLARQLGLVLDNARLIEETKRLSLVDRITGLYNHRFFFDATSRELARSARTGRPVLVMLIGVDGFHEFSHEQGLAAGNDLLQMIASGIMANKRGADIAARYGGDEFAVLLPYRETNGSGVEAASVARRIRDAVAAGVLAGGETPPVRLSIGLAEYPAHATEAAALLERADWALREARESGNGGVVFARNNDFGGAASPAASN